MKKYQIQWIQGKLTQRGYIKRNECLRIGISRLAAYIPKLRVMGYTIKKGEPYITRTEDDFIYRLNV